MQSISFSPLEIQATREYWTAERIANAAPAPFLGMKMPEGRQQKYDEFSQAEREMCFCASGQLTSKYRADVKAPPFKKAGRLYYVTDDGQPLYATAQFVGADNILMTAAHCLKNEFSRRKNEGWSTNILFQRAYQDGQSAQNTSLIVGSINVSSEWGFGNRFNRIKYGYGFAKTVEPSQVGFLELPTKPDIPRKMTAIGYTKNHGNNEKFMYKIHGKTGENKNGAIPLIGNDMDYGSVGGAWFSGKADRRCKIIHGLNVWRDPDGTVFGPILHSHIINDMNKVKNETLGHTVQNQAQPELSANDVDDFFAALPELNVDDIDDFFASL